MLPRLLAPLAVIVVVAATFFPVLDFAFLNWDDQAVVVENGALAAPGVTGWAFTTTYMQHYQPLSWMAWAGLVRAAGVEARWFHAANLAGHLAATLLVFAVSRLVLRRVVKGASDGAVAGAAAVAAALFGLHPLRVEVVAWVSAFPYTLALSLALLSLILWLRAAEPGRRPGFPVSSLMAYAVSLLARPAALGLPGVLVVLDVWLYGRSARASVRRAIPFAVLAVAAAIFEGSARLSGLAEVPWPFRLQMAATAPFVYAWRSVVPLGLTPLYALPLAPEARFEVAGAALVGLVAVSAAAWRWRREWPGASAAWACYLAMLAPAAGLLPSGLQATADRYTYLPGVVLAVGAAGLGLHWVVGAASRRRAATFGAVAAVVAVAAMAAGVRHALPVWADSVTLWTRVVTVDPVSDVGLYNLGSALSAAGRTDEALARYRGAVAVNPAHAAAKANLDRLDAARLEEEGNALAQSGDLLGAIQRYEEAVARDAGRTHARASLGMALATLGRHAEARIHLEEARRSGSADPAVANALGVLLAQAGDIRAARAVLEEALSLNRNDVALALNLTQVLLSGTPGQGGDPALALRLATAVADATGRRDPRIVETLAAALAANGRMTEAREANAEAAALARQQGDEDLAVQITARGRAYRNPGP